MVCAAVQVLKQPARALVQRGDLSGFTKLLELDPEADSDLSLFGAEVSRELLLAAVRMSAEASRQMCHPAAVC